MDAIDACSLVALVRYYLPFDKDSILLNFIERKIESKEIIVLDKVYEQCANIAKGIVVEKLPFLKVKKNQINTSTYLPDATFFNITDNNFINGAVRNRWTTQEYEVKRREFLEDADAKLILYCRKHTNLMDVPRIITEETETSNDNKGFKKIPSLCKIVGVVPITLPEYLRESEEVSFLFK